MGYQVHNDLTYKHTTLNDFNNYMWSFRMTSYSFFGVSEYMTTKLKNFHGKNIVFDEIMTMDNIGTE